MQEAERNDLRSIPFPVWGDVQKVAQIVIGANIGVCSNCWRFWAFPVTPNGA